MILALLCRLKLLLFGMECVFEYTHLEMFCLKLNRYEE